MHSEDRDTIVHRREMFCGSGAARLFLQSEMYLDDLDMGHIFLNFLVLQRECLETDLECDFPKHMTRCETQVEHSQS
jgi:hypothetical protein